MRERAQASVETIALTAAVLALMAALLFGSARLAPPLASLLGQALSQTFGDDQTRAPGLDEVERLLLRGATSAGDDGPTLLDLRTQLRSRLPRPAADASFSALIRPLVARALTTDGIDDPAGRIGIVPRASEDAWLRARFHPGRLRTLTELAVGLAGTPGAILSLADDAGLAAGEQADGIEPGHAAGDLVVQVGAGPRELVLRRRPESGLTVIADYQPIGDGR
jgi:hypothetical protein